MEKTYSPAEVAHITGASATAIRSYSQIYKEYLSVGASPPKGQKKRFTAADVKLIAYVSGQSVSTGVGPTHVEIKEQVDAGALDDFNAPALVVPEHKPVGRKKGQASTTALDKVSNALGAVERLQIMGHEKEKQLYDEISKLNREIGHLQFQLGEAIAMIDMLERENKRLRGEDS